MAWPTITDLGTVPSRNQTPATFSANANAFLGALPTFRTELNSFASYAEGDFTDSVTLIKTQTQAVKDATDVVYTNTVAIRDATQDINDDTDTVYTNTVGIYNDTVEVYGDTVAVRSDIYAIANYKGLWSALTGSLNTPATVYHDNAFWVLNSNLVDVTASEPTPNNADWTSALFISTVIQPATTTSGSLSDLTPTLESSAFRNTLNQCTHFSSDWEVYDSTSTLVFSSYDDESNLVSITTSSLTADSSYTYRVRHTDSDSNDSQWSAYGSFSIPADAVNTPTISSPASASEVSDGQEFTSSAFSTILSVDTHASSDWEVRKVSDDSLIDSSYDDTSNKTTWTPDLSTIGEDASIKVRVRHAGTSLGDSEWSAYVEYSFIDAIVFEKYVDGIAASHTFNDVSYTDHFTYDATNDEIIASTHQGSPAKGFINTFSDDGTSLSLSKNYINSTYSTPMGIGDCGFSDGRILVGGYIYDGSVNRSAVGIVNPSTGAISAYSDSSATTSGYVLGFGVAGAVAAFCGNTRNGDIAADKAVIGYISDPSANTFTVNSYYVSGEGTTTMYNCCILGDGNCVAVGHHFDSASFKATFIRYNTSAAVVNSYKYSNGTYDSYFYSVVPNSSQSSSFIASGYIGIASNGNCCLIVSVSGTTANWKKLFAHANNANPDYAYRVIQDSTQVYFIGQNGTDGHYVTCLNKSTGAVVWSIRDTRASSYEYIYDLKIIEGGLILTGYYATDTTKPFIASINTTNGSVNYVKEADYTQNTYPYQIIETSDGYAICGRYYEGGTAYTPFVIINPQSSADFVDITSTWTYETFTVYEPADTITETSISWTAGTENFTSVSLTVADSAYTTGDIV